MRTPPVSPFANAELSGGSREERDSSATDSSYIIKRCVFHNRVESFEKTG